MTRAWTKTGQIIASLLPKGWQELAHSTGALRRSRKVPNAEVLLRLILLHVAAGLSLRQAVARAKEQGLAQISNVALLKRLRGAGEWLRELTTRMGAEAWAEVRWSVLPAGYRLRAVDASTVQEPGATGTDWRIHYSLSLPSLYCDHLELTDAHGAEKLERFPLQPRDLLLADRGYCHPRSLHYATAGGAACVMRWHSSSLPLWRPNTRALDVLAAVRSLRGYRPREFPVRYRLGQELRPARLCVLRRSAHAAQQERAQAQESARRKQYRASPQNLELCDYLLIISTRPPEEATTAQVLELYRLRWQVELAFKRLKSLLQVGHLPKYDPESSRSWLQAKLLTALLVERLLLEAELFSPWGFSLADLESLEPVSGST
jgi:hypothetical protein